MNYQPKTLLIFSSCLIAIALLILLTDINLLMAQSLNQSISVKDKSRVNLNSLSSSLNWEASHQNLASGYFGGNCPACAAIKS
ncbi:MAG: hypothetical protein ACRDEA_02650 [Microcystaceae cyanobacterium]